MRRIALERIEKFELDPTTRLTLAVKYDISDWLPEAYKALCTRLQPPRDAELRLLAMEHSLKILQARESLITKIMADLSSLCPYSSQSCSRNRTIRINALLRDRSLSQNTDMIHTAFDGGGWCNHCTNRRSYWQDGWTQQVTLAVGVILGKEFSEELKDPDCHVQ